MIQVDRAPDLIKWRFPYDESEQPTIFHIRKSNAAENVYKAITSISRRNDFNDWLADTFGNIERIENFPDKDGNPITIAGADEIIKACQSLKEDDIYTLSAAVHRRGQAYELGLVEKN